MPATVQLWVLAIAIALASCASNPTVSTPPPPREPTQALLLRTEPAGATCSISRDGVVVASVDVAPGIANVPRKNEKIDVECRKEGYLEQRITLTPVRAEEVEREEGAGRAPATRELDAGERAGLFAVDFGLHTLVYFFPPVGIGLVAAAVAAGVASDQTTAQPYAFRQPPRIVLAPAEFESEAACDAHFAVLTAKFEANVAAQRARIRESCHPWPCTTSDPACPNPLCARQRARVDDELASYMDQIRGLRARVRIVAP
jgi:hypothetical protein